MRDRRYVWRRKEMPLRKAIRVSPERGRAGGHFSGPPEGGDAFVFINTHGLGNRAIAERVIAAAIEILSADESDTDAIERRIVAYDGGPETRRVFGHLPRLTLNLGVKPVAEPVAKPVPVREYDAAISIIRTSDSLILSDFLLNKVAIIFGHLPDNWVLFRDFNQFCIKTKMGVKASQVLMNKKEPMKLRGNFDNIGQGEVGHIPGRQVVQDLKEIIDEGQARIDEILRARDEERRSKGIPKFTR